MSELPYHNVLSELIEECITGYHPAQEIDTKWTTNLMYTYRITVIAKLYFYTYRSETLHGLAGKLCRDGVTGVWLVEEYQSISWGHITPVKEVVQLHVYNKYITIKHY